MEFSSLCMSVVIINSIWLLHCTDERMRAAIAGDEVWYAAFGDILDWVFLIFYVGELSVKLVAHGVFFFVGEGASWNLGDLALVVSGLVDNILGLMAKDLDLNMTFLRVVR